MYETYDGYEREKHNEMLSSYANSALLRRIGAWRAASSQLGRSFATVDTSTSETHDDFKPKYKGVEPVNDVNEAIKKDISTHPVFLYMKGVPTAPQCGFSDLVCKILNAYEVQYGSRNVLADAALRDGIKKFTNWPTIPQVFVQGEFIGGADILMGMHQKGELEDLLGPIRKAQAAAAAQK